MTETQLSENNVRNDLDGAYDAFLAIKPLISYKFLHHEKDSENEISRFALMRIILFQCQTVIELLLKACIGAVGGSDKRLLTHQIDELLEKLPDQLKERFQACFNDVSAREISKWHQGAKYGRERKYAEIQSKIRPQYIHNIVSITLTCVGIGCDTIDDHCDERFLHEISKLRKCLQDKALLDAINDIPKWDSFRNDILGVSD